MVSFEINNSVLYKISVAKGMKFSLFNHTVKIPDSVTEISDYVLDDSIICKGYKGGDLFYFKRIFIPKTVTKISPLAFKGINVVREVIYSENDKLIFKLNSEEIQLLFEDTKQLELVNSLKNPLKFQIT